ncbi:hypothetical protein BTVI_105511 [Pitangus sulphuratus]|nr:hypothetical protein BTVI_105511 [Pitangus sulphuratus]
MQMVDMPMDPKVAATGSPGTQKIMVLCPVPKQTKEKKNVQKLLLEWEHSKKTENMDEAMDILAKWLLVAVAYSYCIEASREACKTMGSTRAHCRGTMRPGQGNNLIGRLRQPIDWQREVRAGPERPNRIQEEGLYHILKKKRIRTRHGRSDGVVMLEGVKTFPGSSLAKTGHYISVDLMRQAIKPTQSSKPDYLPGPFPSPGRRGGGLMSNIGEISQILRYAPYPLTHGFYIRFIGLWMEY